MDNRVSGHALDLLADILATQRSPALDPARPPVAGMVSSSFSDADLAMLVANPDSGAPLARAIWFDPELRGRYLGVRATMAAEALDRFRARGWETEASLVAADSVASRIPLNASGFCVLATQIGMDWLLSLEIEQAARDDVPDWCTVRVRDDGGMVWLQGRLGELGEIDAAWPSHSVDPRTRSRDHRVLLDFV